MPIHELPDHSYETFCQQIRFIEDCIYRIKSYIEPEVWDKADLVYVQDQCERLRGYLLCALGCVIAQGGAATAMKLTDVAKYNGVKLQDGEHSATVNHNHNGKAGDNQ
jgi:hypothetical protein